MKKEGMLISMIAIVAHDGAIGVGGDQPFHIREDFRRFKELTIGKPIVMGRRTFEALPKGALPGRMNIVVTRSAGWSAEGVTPVSSVDAAVDAARASGAAEVMIIGGGEIYRQSMPVADRLYITEVDADVPDADTFFPPFDPTEWTLTSSDPYEVDPRSGAPYRFLVFDRRTR